MMMITGSRATAPEAARSSTSETHDKSSNSNIDVYCMASQSQRALCLVLLRHLECDSDDDLKSPTKDDNEASDIADKLCWIAAMNFLWSGWTT
jgi:hypothetical protein